MAEGTPTEDDLVRIMDEWVHGDEDSQAAAEKAGRAFDEWLAEVKAEALEEAADVLRDYAPATPSPTYDAMVEQWLRDRAAAIRGEDTRCTCDWTSEDRGGGYFELVADYDPACPQHSVHVWNPRTQVWEQP